jgi:hypothetical protein
MNTYKLSTDENGNVLATEADTLETSMNILQQFEFNGIMVVITPYDKGCARVRAAKGKQWVGFNTAYETLDDRKYIEDGINFAFEYHS